MSASIAFFYAKQTRRSALLWGFVFGLAAASSAWGFVTAYPTEAGRQAFAATFGSNAGLQALIGHAYRIDTIGGFTQWRALGLITLIGAIWGFMLAAKLFRGEEDKGRLELLLAGPITPRRAVGQILAGIGITLLSMFSIAAIMLLSISRTHNVQLGAGSCLLLAFALLLSGMEFIAVGLLASQLLPTRARTLSVSAGVFGLFFLLRAMGDAAPSVHWLVDLSPLGWIESVQPLTGAHPLWLVPIGVFITTLCTIALFLANKRDLGDSLFADKDTAPARTRLLNSPLGLALRGQRAVVLAWFIGISIGTFLIGSVAKSAGNAFSNTAGSVGQALGRITGAQIIGSKTFLGIVFFMVITLIMALAASQLSAMRNDEAEGYVDNLLVRPVDRTQWALGRLGLIYVSIIIAGFLAGTFAWIGANSQHTGVSFGTLLSAGSNTMVPAIVVTAIGTLTFGLLPRFTSAAAYGVVAWSFLMEMIGSVLNLNHWILDTSVLHHIAAAPAIDPRWEVNILLLVLSMFCSILGLMLFARRDIMAE
ncbi:MAG TPA: ABC transporter permease subunit [Candidatus Saccharimonadales bacterium]|nr:ABC transporter permease subunit [Candidatus Saccharimonadales bacterium]